MEVLQINKQYLLAWKYNKKRKYFYCGSYKGVDWSALLFKETNEFKIFRFFLMANKNGKYDSLGYYDLFLSHNEEPESWAITIIDEYL